MSMILMLTAGGISAGFVIWYLVSAVKCKKQVKDKNAISEELVELLKE